MKSNNSFFYIKCKAIYAKNVLSMHFFTTHFKFDILIKRSSLRK